MSRVNVKDVIVGGTYKGTWVSSGAQPDSLVSLILDADENVLSSVTPVNSGNGAYYALHQLPNTPGLFVNEWQAVVDSFMYRNRELVRTNDIQVD